MKINPGGALALEDIVGRDTLVAEVMDILETQSLQLVAERRMGKTHVLSKLEAQQRDGWVMVKRDLEGVRSAGEFVQYVLADLHPLLGNLKKFREWLASIGSEASGLKIGPVTLPNFAAKSWKQGLVDTLAHLSESVQTQYVVFLWDELPMMLQNLAKTAPQEAMELLDVLRSIRQENAKVRMVFTGSIGLHHVVRHLKQQGYVNAPVNDMVTMEVPPLAHADATSLALRLFQDNRIALADDAVASVVAAEVDNIPFYIHHVLREFKSKHAGSAHRVTADDVRKEVADAIRSARDPWHLKHYEERTREYYASDRPACHALLDAVASAEGAMSMQSAINRAKSAVPALDRESWLELTHLLERDYYVVRDPDSGELHYKFSIVARWWRWHRGVSTTEGGAA
ncbi:hypothetical protein NWF24_30620 [Variovorax paradoxus]|uniref:hypothetical protein n=1 Tax=Variovorax paradoxus TaxID=34073 RepID=UPI0021AC9AE6|nr:hypothetical protein [Variovorax paradoxus]UVH57145.1 hypothetical protein NWF24_30620 [Variovorax paradoxus]